MAAPSDNTLSSKIPPELQEQLREFRGQLWRTKLIEAILAGIVGLLLSFLIVFTLDRLMPTPGWLRLGVLIAGTSLATFFAPYWIHRWLFKNRRENQLARLISKRFPRLGDQLLGVLELSKQKESSASLSPTLLAAATRDVAAAAAQRNFGEALPSSRNRIGLIAVAGLILLTGSAFLILPQAGLNALKRWLLPLSDTPRYTLTQFDKELPKRMIVPLGEPFSLTVSLSEKSKNRPQIAQARYAGQSWIESRRKGLSYQFDFSSQQKQGNVSISAGDARTKIKIIPTLPPTLESVQATIEYPAYLEKSTRQIDVRSGNLSILTGSNVTLHANASRDLAVGFMKVQELELTEEESLKSLKSLTAEAAKRRVSYPTLLLAKSPTEVQLSWQDTLGLKGSESFRLRLNPLEDHSPTIYIQGTQRQHAILAEETIEFEVIANDDFGLRNLGLEWQGEFTKPSPGAPAQGELELSTGHPEESQLSTQALFSPIVYQIKPQKLTLRAFTEDYLPDRGRVYSQPITLYILTRDEHAQMLKDRFDRVIGELEDASREEQQNLDENKRLERLSDEDLAKPTNQKRLQQQEEAEKKNIEQMEELNKQMEQVFQDALRNGTIDKDAMKKLSNTENKLRDLTKKDLPKVEEQLKKAQDQRSTAEQSKSDLKKAIEEQQKALDKMKETLEKANEANRDFEAATFVNRLKRAATEHDGIADSLQGAIGRLIGLRVKEIDPADERLLGELTLQQKRTASDIRWISEDLGHFFTRTEKPIHQQLLTAMKESNIDEGLEWNRERLESNLTFRSIIFSMKWAEQLRAWAALLEGEKNAPNNGGGGGGGGGSVEDQDFEFMLKVMAMIQSEQDIRSRTRAIEQLRRNQQNQGEPLQQRIP